jgi:hypothetical protein
LFSPAGRQPVLLPHIPTNLTLRYGLQAVSLSWKVGHAPRLDGRWTTLYNRKMFVKSMEQVYGTVFLGIFISKISKSCLIKSSESSGNSMTKGRRSRNTKLCNIMSRLINKTRFIRMLESVEWSVLRRSESFGAK